MRYTEETVLAKYQAMKAEARRLLATLAVAQGREPPESLSALNGWVFEQTLRCCLEEELQDLGLVLPSEDIEEQVSLPGRARIDLRVGSVAIEIKVAGFVGEEGFKRYLKYRKQVEEKEWKYFYVTRQETYPRYRSLTQDVFGTDRAFFLDQAKAWSGFVSAVAELLRQGRDRRARSSRRGRLA